MVRKEGIVSLSYLFFNWVNPATCVCCLRWYHHVYTPPSRSLAVNFWFAGLQWFNQTDCEGVERENVPLKDFKLASSNMEIRLVYFINYFTVSFNLKDRIWQWPFLVDRKYVTKIFFSNEWRGSIQSRNKMFICVREKMLSQRNRQAAFWGIYPIICNTQLIFNQG